MSRPQLLIALCALAITAQAQAALVEITSDQRFLTISGVIYDLDPACSDAPLCPKPINSNFEDNSYHPNISPIQPLVPVYGDSLQDNTPTGTTGAYAAASSEQTSLVTTELFEASGLAAATTTIGEWAGSIGSSQAKSHYEVWFTVNDPVRYSLTGSLLGSGGSTQMQFLDMDFFSENNNEIELDLSGILEPGDYTFSVIASAINNNSPASYDFSMTMTAVPLPAASYLFGSGLLGLVGISRRKKAS